MKLNHGVPVRRRRFSPQQRSLILDQFERSPLAAAEFAVRHGVGVSTLYHWRRRSEVLRRPTAPSRPAQAVFQSIPLGQVLGATSSWVGEVSLPDGTQLRWNSQLSAAALQEVLAHLRRPC
jgi:transposase-like protein